MVADNKESKQSLKAKRSLTPRTKESLSSKEQQTSLSVMKVTRRNAEKRALSSREDCTTASESEHSTSYYSNSSTKIPIFLTPKPSSHWTKITWGEIKTECNDLIDAVEQTMSDNLLTTTIYTHLHEMKRALQTAIRRRNRIPDEVWLCYRALQRAHEDVCNGNSFGEDGRRCQSAVFPFPLEYNTNDALDRNGVQSQPMPIAEEWETEVLEASASIISSNGDAPGAVIGDQMGSSCLDIFSSTLIRCGLELELYDEDTTGLQRMAGVGIGIAVFVAICTVVYYL